MSDPLHIREIFSSIQGEGLLAGRRQIFIRLTECNLDCSYCDTPFQKGAVCQIETEPGSGTVREVPQAVSRETCLDLLASWTARLPGAHHSVSITGGEPLLSTPILETWLGPIRDILPVHLETNGTMPDALELIIRHVDYISMDMKIPSASGCGDCLDLHRRFLQVALEKQVSVKVVVCETSTAEEIHQVCDIITTLDRSVPLFIQPVTLPEGSAGISAARLLQLQQIAAARLPDARVIPQMHKLLGVL